MWTKFAASILLRLHCNLHSRVSLFVIGGRTETGHVIEQL
jgi:hypothetical protein